MTRCDPRLVKVVRECASGRKPSDPYMARIAEMLGLVQRGRNDNHLWPSQRGVEVARAVMTLERGRA